MQAPKGPHPDWSLTIFNPSTSPEAVKVMSIVALIFIPIVVAYLSWSYYVFRKRIKADREHLVYKVIGKLFVQLQQPVRQPSEKVKPGAEH